MKESQVGLLYNLAQFKYLNSHQMVRLNIVAGRNYLYSQVIPGLRDMRRPFIKRKIMPVLPHK